MGMVGHTTPSMQNNLLKILISISEGKGEDAAEIVCRMSETTKEFDIYAFKKAISAIVVERQGQALQSINVGRTLLQVTKIAADQGLHVPSDLTMLGKTLLQLDEVGKILDPEFVRTPPSAATSPNHVQAPFEGRKQGQLLRDAARHEGVRAGLPMRLNKIMDAVTNKDLEVKVRAVDAPIIMEACRRSPTA